MRVGLAIAASGVLLGLGSATGLAAGPGVADLPKALADPLEKSFIEVGPGTSGVLEGYFDAQIFADNTGSSATERNAVADQLRSADFVTGYGREFFIPKQTDWLYEIVMVFRQPSGARSVLSTNKVDYARASGFDSFVDVHMNAGAFGATETDRGFHWTVVQFVKSNDLFVIARGTQNDFTTTAALAQAQRAYEIAPAGTTVAAPTLMPAAITNYIRPLEIAAFLAALVAGAASMVIVFLLFRPTRQVQTQAVQNRE